MTAPTMLARAQEYLAFRRTLGLTLGTPGQEVLLFARWADRIGHSGPLTTELIVRWAQLTPRRSPAYWAWRFHAVRLFARHRALSDPQTEVPPAGLLGPTFRRARPHIYSAAEIAALLAAARTLRRGLRPYTYGTVFGLLSATGLRVGGALALSQADVDLEQGLLTIRKAKAGQSRLVPLHRSTTEALRHYVTVRDRMHVGQRTEAFFVTVRGTALTYQWVTKTFRTLRRLLKWATTPRAGACGFTISASMPGSGLCRIHRRGHCFRSRCHQLAACRFGIMRLLSSPRLGGREGRRHAGASHCEARRGSGMWRHRRVRRFVRRVPGGVRLRPYDNSVTAEAGRPVQ